jgi:hypothetical protein
MLEQYYRHFCAIPTGQAVAWTRRFSGGETHEYHYRYWGRSNVMKPHYDVWWTLPNSFVQVNYGDDGYLDRVWIAGHLQKTFRGEKAYDGDGYGPAPAPRVVKSAAPAAKPATGTAPPAEATPEKTIRATAAEAIPIGAKREELIAALGAHHQRSAIVSDKGEMETLVYHLKEGGSFRFELVNGIVRAARRN